MTTATSDQIPFVVDAVGMFAERHGTVIVGIDDCRNGGGRTWIAGKGWRYDGSMTRDDWLTAQSDVKFMGVVEGGVQTIRPRVGCTKLLGGGGGRFATFLIGA